MSTKESAFASRTPPQLLLLLPACRPCSNRSMSPAHRELSSKLAHSSKPVATPA